LAHCSVRTSSRVDGRLVRAGRRVVGGRVPVAGKSSKGVRERYTIVDTADEPRTHLRARADGVRRLGTADGRAQRVRRHLTATTRYCLL